MKLNINPTDDHHFSIMQRFLDGILSIDSIEEFKEILNIYPKDPFLYRKYADLLSNKASVSAAEQAYNRTAELFIEQGMSLQAIVAKILEWSIHKPSHEQGRAFYALLHEEGAQHTPLQRFWARLSYAELVAVILRLVRLRLPAGAAVVEAHDPVEDIFFIVSGSVVETISLNCAAIGSVRDDTIDPVLLAENDIFGDILPLSQSTVSGKQIKTASEVELVKLAKSVLRDLCHKHPRIESLLQDMYKAENRNGVDRTWQTVRRNLRFGLPTRAEVIFGSTDNTDHPWQYSGIAVDLSLGGICLDLGETGAINGGSSLINPWVRIRLNLSDQKPDLTITGKVIWQRRQRFEKTENTLIGIRFDPLKASDRHRLLHYCTEQGGEQNLLWSLWDTMVKTENLD